MTARSTGQQCVLEVGKYPASEQLSTGGEAQSKLVYKSSSTVTWLLTVCLGEKICLGFLPEEGLQDLTCIK